jgi:ATP-dependent DNA helicase RecG
MNNAQLQSTLNDLLLQWESEVVEFKEANDSFSTSDIGKYFSALSNEANLRDLESAWLVFGVSNKSRTVVGTDYGRDSQRLQSLKHHIAQGLKPSTGFKDIYELMTPQGRVVLFQIPAAPRGIPIAWDSICYGRNGQSLAGLSISKLDEIRAQNSRDDWSAVICTKATLNDLDSTAMQRAREILAAQQKDAPRAQACLALSDYELLEKLELGSAQKISHAALLLLGKASASLLLSPFVAELTWKLEGEGRNYEHFGMPFLLNTSRLFQKIRNLRLSFLPPGQLIPIDVPKYDQTIVLEALHNCIAHQDYRACERVLVIERPHELELSNAGAFYDGQPMDYVLGTRTPRSYRNKVLAKAMAALRMVDTLGYGIREVMFRGQARRYLPLPDFDLSDPKHVTLTLAGRFVDENYSRALLLNQDMPLRDTVALDRVQKHLPIDTVALQALRKRELVEGRKNALHVSVKVADATDQKAQYIRGRSQGDEHYRKLILDYLNKFKTASRDDIREMLFPLLPDVLTLDQKEVKVKNLMALMRKTGQICSDGRGSIALWRIG